MAAQSIPSFMTADEFIRVYGNDDDDRHELIDGRVCERIVTGYSHDMVKNNLKELFDQAGVGRHGYKCWIEHSCRLANSSVMTPDVAIIRTDRLKDRTGNFPTSGAPEIPIEVVISDEGWVLQRKISAYLANGARAVCCAYPNLRTIVVYTAHEWRELSGEDKLEFPALLPGVAIPVSAVFEGV
jgi:Uma2 family endonuclease